MEGASGGALAGGHGAAGESSHGAGPLRPGLGEAKGRHGCSGTPGVRKPGSVLAQLPGAVRLCRCVLRRGPGGLGFPCPAPRWGSWPSPRFRTAALGICCSYFLEYEFVYFQKRTNVELTQ